MTLDWTGADAAHVERHGVSRAEIDGMIALGWYERFANPNGPARRPRFIGYTDRGRLITLIVQIVPVDPAPGEIAEVGVPIACWPANPTERTEFTRRFWRQRRP